MTVCYSIEIEILFCKVGFDDQTILVYFVGIADLHSLPCSVGVALLQLFL